MGDFKASFLAFCDSTKKGSDKASDKTAKKIFTDCGVFKHLKMTSNDMDISISSYKGKQKLKGDMDFTHFSGFLKQFCGEAATKKNVADAAKAEEEVKKLICDNRPAAHGTTKISSTGGVEKMTDTSQYTGAHKNRFGEDGKGKGIQGREDVHENTGYVGAYKEKGTYDKKH